MDTFNQIKPFQWIAMDDGSASVTLYAREKYKKKMFRTRKKDGFTGSGDDWSSLAQVFIREALPEIQDEIHFDPEQGMFCAYSQTADALERFIIAFADICQNNDDLLYDYFSRAEPQKPITADDMKRALDMMMNGGKE